MKNNLLLAKILFYLSIALFVLNLYVVHSLLIMRIIMIFVVILFLLSIKYIYLARLNTQISDKESTIFIFLSRLLLLVSVLFFVMTFIKI